MSRAEKALHYVGCLLTFASITALILSVMRMGYPMPWFNMALYLIYSITTVWWLIAIADADLRKTAQ